MRLRKGKVAPKPFDTGNIDDDARLESLADQADLSEPRHWSHFLVFPDEAQARQAAEIIGQDWDTQVQPSPEGDGWTLQARRDDARISPTAVTAAREALTLVAGAHGGSYNSWIAWL